VVRSGEKVISNVIFSQIAMHQPYGGVVPELASREHLRAILPVVRKALSDAGQTYQSTDAFAVTQGPGLAGSLLVGISYAKVLALGYPGGPVIDKLAPHGDATAVKFPPSQIKNVDRRKSAESEQAPGGPRFDFSYSGIKTAVLRYVQTHNLQPSIEARRQALAAIAKPAIEDYLTRCDRQTLDLVAS